MSIDGPLKSVYIVNDDDLRVNGGRWKLQSGKAIRTRGYTSDTIGSRKVYGGDALPVYVLGENDIRPNGGNWLLQAGEPTPVTSAIGAARGIKQGAAVPIYPVDDDGVYDSSFAGAAAPEINAYRDKVLGYNPTIYYMMSEAAGAAVAVDSSGNGLDGTYANVTLGLDGIGDGRTCADYNGATSILTSPDISAVFDGDEYSFYGDEYSIAFWLQNDDWTTDFKRVCRWYFDANNNGDISIAAADGWLASDRKATAFDDAKGDTGSPPGTTWLHGVTTCSVAADDLLIYFDGVLQADQGATLGNWVGAENLVNIGAQAGPGLVLDGRLAHFAIWYGTVLTQPQITDLSIVP
jgi:hypothetical protein